MKSIVLALLPGLEEETSEEFDRILKLMDSFKSAIRPPGSEQIAGSHSTGDDFFWQCFFLASITGQTRRLGALAYLTRNLPKLAEEGSPDAKGDSEVAGRLASIVTSPEPGLLIRCFAAGLGDEQLLIQRGYLDLLVTHLPLHAAVLQSKAKQTDLQLLLRAASGVVTRRDMSLNRRLWAWLLGPEPPHADGELPLESPSADNPQYLTSKTSYFEEHGLQPLTQALLAAINTTQKQTPVERARPYRVCLSLMDRWEIGGLVVPELFLPIVDSVRSYKSQAESKADFHEVLRSASVFFDGVESGLIYGEIVRLLAEAVGPGDASYTQRIEKLNLVNFIISSFNIREEEMVTIHAPLAALSILCMLENAKDRRATSPSHVDQTSHIHETALNIAVALLDLVPMRAFPSGSEGRNGRKSKSDTSAASLSDTEVLKRISAFYVEEQGAVDNAPLPFHGSEVAELLLHKSSKLGYEALALPESFRDLSVRVRILVLLLLKIPEEYEWDTESILSSIRKGLQKSPPINFTAFSSMLSLATHLYSSERISTPQLSDLVVPLVRHAWAYLSASDPKYHVETVRCLWQLQTALTPQNRDIEAAIAGLMIEKDIGGTFAARPSEPGRSFSVLWSHTLQDSPSHMERRGSKTPITEHKLFAMPRLAGLDHYDVMLTQPLFLMLDALLDERTQLFMAAKAWLSTMVGIDR